MDLRTLLIVCPLVFLAGFADSVAGGGGIISLPAYLMAGIPAHLAAGTNKVVNGSGTLISAVQYFRRGKVRLRPAAAAALGALAGSAAGAQLASNLAAVVWIAHGDVLWSLAPAAMACSILGNHLGARYAIRGGSKRVRSMMFVVLGLLYCKLLGDLLPGIG